MATLSHLLYPQLISLSSSHYHPQNPSSSLLFRSCFLLNRKGCYRRQSIVCLASTRKSRSNRKLMSDEDLCSMLREFVASVGLPEGHVPSTKDLSKHGRKDLANVVRRRGHKVIKELLSDTTEAVTDKSDTQQNLMDKASGILSMKKQEGKVNELSVKSADITLVNDGSSTENSLETKYESAVSPDVTLTNDSSAIDHSLETKYESAVCPDDVTLTNNSSVIDHSLEMKYESAVSPDDVTLTNGSSAIDHSLETKYESAVNPDDITLTNDSLASEHSLETKYESAVSPDDQSHVLIESPASLQEKVDKFMRYGQLDMVEDGFGNDIKFNNVDNSESSSRGGNLVESQSAVHEEGDVRRWTSVGNDVGLNGSLMEQSVLAPPTGEDNVTSRSYSSAFGQQDAGFHNDVSIEASKMENEVEINHLKHMLHQKELELSRLKEEIEKEKEALSILQAKAEIEISKAQKLISEKDAELHSAEESLSGLVEAKIQYSGEGQMVEVAGSFNGWHQRIKLEPQLSSTLLDPTDTRKSRLWSTTLWLYPGVYEIKFVVDGQWKIDPKRESTIKGGIENNVLRVDR